MCATAQMCIKWKWGTSISPFPPSNGLEYRHGRGSVLYHGEKGSILEITEQQDRRKLAFKYFRATLLALISLWIVFLFLFLFLYYTTVYLFIFLDLFFSIY